MKRKKFIIFFLVLALIVPTFAGCSSKKPSSAKTVQNSEQKPELKVLMYYQPYDPNQDKGAKKVQELTGYKVKYFLLPQKDPDEKLMLELSSGNDYDIVKVNAAQFGALASANALMDIGSFLDKYAPNIKKRVSDASWKAITVGGKRLGMPFENTGATIKNPKGMFMGGIFVRTDILDKLGLKLPTTVDEFTDMLKKLKGEKGLIPLTGYGSNVWDIRSGFGLASSWRDVNGSLVSDLKLQGTKEYLTYMASAYKEGLIDKDWPINKFENVVEKFTTGKAAALNCNFWDIPSLMPALKKNFPNADAKFILPLKGKDGKPCISVGKGGLANVEVVPKTAKHPEDAIKFSNLRADPDIWLKSYLGQEGVTYKVENRNYYPIFPAFNDYVNAKQFTGVPDVEKEWILWQARARKTPEMAKAYDELNSVTPKEGLYEDITPAASNLDPIRKNSSALAKMVDDFQIKVIAGAVPVSDLDKFIKQWEQQGGADMEKAINEWYKENQDLYTK
ncbi:MAG TPA: hypothetical protein DD426_06085 [Clostridiaceae bacterium]|nr:hypothetical protein [Clostridiaceae bacterium]